MTGPGVAHARASAARAPPAPRPSVSEATVGWSAPGAPTLIMCQGFRSESEAECRTLSLGQSKRTETCSVDPSLVQACSRTHLAPPRHAALTHPVHGTHARTANDVASTGDRRLWGTSGGLGHLAEPRGELRSRRGGAVVRQGDGDAANQVHGSAEGHPAREETEAPDRSHATSPAWRRRRTGTNSAAGAHWPSRKSMIFEPRGRMSQTPWSPRQRRHNIA
jgi:hypothetical protein